MKDITSLVKIISKDFDLEEQSSEEALRDLMIDAFAYLLENDFQKLLQILYRADVDQDKLKVSLENSTTNSAQVIADAYLERQKAKIETWKKYSS
jgi:hypothetical protein